MLEPLTKSISNQFAIIQVDSRPFLTKLMALLNNSMLSIYFLCCCMHLLR